jgi:hypothetical protein
MGGEAFEEAAALVSALRLEPDGHLKNRALGRWRGGRHAPFDPDLARSMAYWKPPRTGQQAMQVARMRMPPGAVCGGLPGATSTISALPPQLAQHCSASRTGTMIMRRAGVDRDRRRCRQLRSQGWHPIPR